MTSFKLAMRIGWIALALIMAYAVRAEAQPAPPALVPPKVANAETVPYPPWAQGDSVVVLELLIAVSGAVQEAKVINGDEPFATAAQKAAVGWTFTPARRGDVTVAARVRMRIEFHPPVVVPPEPAATGAPPPGPVPAGKSPPGASGASGATATSPPAPQPEVQDVQVRGTRPEAGKISVGGGEVRQVPGAFGDAFRMMEALPGVTPVVSGLPFFFVRGAPPGNTGYFLDGVRVPLLYHLAAGPSVIHPALIDRVDFFPGGYPAQYGRFAGGVLAGYTRPPATTFHGDWNLRLLDAGALLESPFASGRGTALVGGRYGYPGLILPLFAPDTRLSYWDYQARASWKLDERNAISAFVFGSYDYLAEVKKDERGERKTKQLFATMFHRLDLRFDHRFDGGGNLRVAGTLGVDKSGGDTGDATSQMAGLRAELERRLSPVIRMRMGADAFFEHFDLFDERGVQNLTGDTPSILYSPRDDLTFGAYADATWHLGPRVEVVTGLRADLFTSHQLDRPGVLSSAERQQLQANRNARELGVDPRLAVRLGMTPKFTLVSTFGVSHQPPSLVIPVPGAGLAKLGDGLQTSVQTSQGFELLLPGDFTATANVFLHNFIGLTDATATCLRGNEFNLDDLDDSSGRSCIARRVRGRAYGLELLIKRSLTKRLTGWLSYTLSRTTRDTTPGVARRFRALLPEEPSTILGEFDRTHVLNLIGAYDLGSGWRVGGRFFFYSGRPYSKQAQGFLIPPYNSERLPPYFRIDFRLEKAWTIGKTGRISFVLEGLNVTLNKEKVNVQCEISANRGPIRDLRNITPDMMDRCTPEEIGPVTVPSIGLEGSF
ncbi:TonB-dependent receptor domain-containing protein [Pendulispora albinea]|uniref:TonB-dependent receptor n=1 Tax=Pendulispora albinea TaxID=2741071 RepID=A0ABZ2M0Q5_9BACT